MITPPIIGPIARPIVAPIGGGGLPWDASGGGAPYDPATEAGVILDLWAESGVTQAGTGVSSWVDRKGSRNYAQGTDANRPTYEAAGLGGRPSILFVRANTDSLMLATGLTSTAKSYSLIAVVDPVTVVGAANYVLDSQTGRQAFCLETNLGAVGWLEGGSFATQGAASDAVQIMRWRLAAGGNGETFRGNTSLGTDAYTGTDLGAASAIGSDYVGTGNSNARFSRVILSATLDDVRDARIMAYLSGYYGTAL
jgi:hypothetical protein